MSAQPKLKVSCARNIFVFNQLQIEEALFRTTEDNWCVLIQGSAPAIVMGVLGEEETFIDRKQWEANPLPILRRYTGGGTVVVDQQTVFLAWICNKNFLAKSDPQGINTWVYEHLRRAMHPLLLLQAGHDYAITVEGNLRKIAGNAQAFSAHRWVHHTSIVFEYAQERMQLLKMPSIQPIYRAHREHANFLYPLRKSGLTEELFKEKFLQHLDSHFEVEHVPYKDLEQHLQTPHRQAARWLR